MNTAVESVSCPECEETIGLDDHVHIVEPQGHVEYTLHRGGAAL